MTSERTLAIALLVMVAAVLGALVYSAVSLGGMVSSLLAPLTAALS